MSSMRPGSGPAQRCGLSYALIFHSLTVHAGRPNTTDRLRRSCEFRYQRVSDPAVVSTVRFPHWHPSIPDWPELTRGWTSLRSVEVRLGRDPPA